MGILYDLMNRNKDRVSNSNPMGSQMICSVRTYYEGHGYVFKNCFTDDCINFKLQYDYGEETGLVEVKYGDVISLLFEDFYILDKRYDQFGKVKTVTCTPYCFMKYTDRGNIDVNTLSIEIDSNVSIAELGTFCSNCNIGSIESFTHSVIVLVSNFDLAKSKVLVSVELLEDNHRCDVLYSLKCEKLGSDDNDVQKKIN